METFLRISFTRVIRVREALFLITEFNFPAAARLDAQSMFRLDPLALLSALGVELREDVAAALQPIAELPLGDGHRVLVMFLFLTRAPSPDIKGDGILIQPRHDPDPPCRCRRPKSV